MGSVEDTKRALLASGLPVSGGLVSVDSFTYKFSDYLTALIDGTGEADKTCLALKISDIQAGRKQSALPTWR